MGGKDAGHEKVHEAPELHEVVLGVRWVRWVRGVRVVEPSRGLPQGVHLEGGAGDEEAALGVESEQRLPPLGLPVLDHVSLVQDQVPMT